MKVSIGLLWITAVAVTLIVMLMTALRLPQVGNEIAVDLDRHFGGAFGAIMMGMLPAHLPFTLFMPSEPAFKTHLGLALNRSDHSQLSHHSDAYALLSRVLAFSAVPRALLSAHVAPARESCYQSISGYALCVSKDRRGMLVVNNRVRSKAVDLRAGQLVVHLMDGVLMDSEFYQSLQPDD